MKHLLTIFRAEFKHSKKISLAGIIVVLAFFTFLFSRNDPTKSVFYINFYFFVVAIGLLLYSGILTSILINREWKERTGLLNFTLPLSRWKIFLSKTIAVFSSGLMIITVFLIGLYLLLMKHVPNPIIPGGNVSVLNQNSINVMPNFKIVVFIGYLKIFILTVIPSTLAVVGLTLLAISLYRIISIWKIPIALIAFIAPIYGVIELILYLDRQIIGPLPFCVPLTILKMNGQFTILNQYITMLPFILLFGIGILAIIFSFWILQNYLEM